MTVLVSILAVAIVLGAASAWIWLTQRILPGRIGPRIMLPALVFGALSPLPVLLGFRFWMPSWLDAESGLGEAFVMALSVTALPEESVKLVSALGVIWVFRASIGPSQAFRVPILVGLAFAAVENIFYSFNASITSFAAHELGTALAIPLMRSVLSSFLHASLGCLMGFFLARFLAIAGGNRRDLVLAFVVPVLGHAAVNWGLIVPAFAVASGGPIDPKTVANFLPHFAAAAIAIPLVIVGAGYCLIRMRRMSMPPIPTAMSAP
jgi:RsiW-degrading membrane proteinase PrsW (M82 family)